MRLVPLIDASGQCGAKARHLGRLLRAGYPVPAGFAVPDPLGDPTWENELASALPRLGPGPYAVRSSAPSEDGADASFAGQLTSVLGVTTAEEVIEAAHRSARSGGTAGSYAARTGRDTPAAIPVIVQVMVRSDAAGVMFTRHPVTGADQVVIDATRGLGEPVAAGTVTPASYRVHGSRVDTGHDDPVLTTAQARALAAMGRRIEDLFGHPQDIEWAITGNEISILQSRPITTRPDAAVTQPPEPAKTLLTGIPASPGTATGPARIITGLDDFPRFQPGDVLVCRTTSPAWTPLLARACAVVTETGGILAHAAIVAREFGIPAVLAARDATTTVNPGRTVRVDGTRGHVTTDHRTPEGNRCPTAPRPTF